MNNALVDHELFFRLGFFAGVFLAMALWEMAAPRRVLTTHKTMRWANNLGVTGLNSLMLRFLFPIQAVGIALLTEKYEWGVFHLIKLSPWTAVLVTVIALDAVIYFQHRLFHRVRVFWRFHQMHHADLDIDVTTGSRFHPLEIALSMVIKMFAVFLIGPPAAAVVLFEIVLNALALFNHGNVKIALGLDRVLRKIIVTPDMHRVHHSVLPVELNSNFGFNLSVWDRLFNTYQPQPAAGHEAMTIGLRQYRDPSQGTFMRMLKMPFNR